MTIVPEPTKCQTLLLHVLSSFETLGDMKCRYQRQLKDNKHVFEALKEIEKEEQEAKKLEEEMEEFWEEGEEEDIEQYELPGLSAESLFWRMTDPEYRAGLEKKKAELDKMKDNIIKMQEHIRDSLVQFKSEGCLLK